MSVGDRLNKHAVRCLVFLLILLNSTFVWADLSFDQDNDCDVDGVDLFILIAASGNNLQEFADEFGTIDACCSFNDVGTPVDGYPNWQERTMIVFTNMVRMAPIEYRDTYMSDYYPPAGGILGLYPAVVPLYWNYELNQAARFHAEDMALNCGLQHISCDGTEWYDRIRNFYPYSGALGENIAYGPAMPWETVNLFLCDGNGSVCAIDHDGQDGHRRNIMQSAFKEIGTGYAQRYWVQDFGGRNPEVQPPVVSASHAFLENGLTSFLLNYFDSSAAAPQEIMLVLDDVQYALDLDTGTGATGSYRVDVDSVSGCRSYYFLVKAADGTCSRYPGASHFYTYLEGDCVLDYDAGPD